MQPEHFSSLPFRVIPNIHCGRCRQRACKLDFNKLLPRSARDLGDAVARRWRAAAPCRGSLQPRGRTSWRPLECLDQYTISRSANRLFLRLLRVSVSGQRTLGITLHGQSQETNRQRILPAMHWRMNELWFLFPLPPADPAPRCSASASHFSRLWTSASGAAANALPALNGIFPDKQSRMNWLWVRVLGPGPEPLCRESVSQAL